MRFKWNHVSKVLAQNLGRNETLTEGCVCAQSLSCVQLSVTPRLLCPWDFPGRNTGVGCYFLLQGIFPAPGVELASPAPPALVGGFFAIVPHAKPVINEGVVSVYA